jgi:large subunit ribosomal protein L22
MTMESYQAVQRNARISPRKARLSAALIRGKRVEDAINILSFEARRGSYMMKKVLESAVANASSVAGIDPMDLTVSDARVDNGFVIKRFRPQSRGRAHARKKRCSHITIAVTKAAPAPRKAKAKTPAKSEK